MFKTFSTRASRVVIFLLALAGLLSAADAPVVTGVTPKGTPSAGQSVEITVTGTGFTATNSSTAAAQDLSLKFLPAGSATVKSQKLVKDPTTNNLVIDATVTIASNTSQTINVTATANGQTGSQLYAWDTGIAVNDCLEASKAGGCELRWEVDATGVTGATTQTNTNTSPNVMVKLDWQIAKNKDSSLTHPGSTAKPGAHTEADRFGLHLIFKAGYAPVSVATQLKPASSTSTSAGTATPSAATAETSAAASTPCPTSTTTTPSSCTAPTTQQAFVGEAGGHLGWTFGQDGSGTFAEFGFAARGSLQGLVSSSQLFQNGTINYQALSNVSTQDAIKLGEVTTRFRLGEHDGPASTVTKAYTNTSDLLLIEGGYQYNSGLGQLAGNPTVNTTERLVARFYLFPELPNSNHTRIPIGIEYSAGIHGGPRVLQFVYGTNLNLGKLFGSSNSNQ